VLILMTGPGYGHNIAPWLEYFQDRSAAFELWFLCNRFDLERSRFPDLRILEYGTSRRRFLERLLALRRYRFDVLYLHGAHQPIYPLLVTGFVRHKVAVVNVWGNRVIDGATGRNGPTRFLFRRLFAAIDHVFFTWLGTIQRFETAFPALRHKAVLTPWGLHRDWFRDDRPPPGDFTGRFLASIPPNAVFCFWPKSILPGARIDLVIAALERLWSGGMNLDNLRLCLWTGNVEDAEYRAELETRVKSLRLEDQVLFTEHPFVSFTDMHHLWQRADFGLNIVDHDQLSTTILEPMLLEKELLLSDIEPYRILNERYRLGLGLVENTTDGVTEALGSVLSARAATPKALLEHRSQVIRDEFSFDRNLDKTMAFLAREVEAS
jgi:glycosyltransferase involved in cell wall biosynthesis